MNKIKLLMPILGISTIAATAIPLASCNCGNKNTETIELTFDEGEECFLTKVDFVAGKTYKLVAKDLDKRFTGMASMTSFSLLDSEYNAIDYPDFFEKPILTYQNKQYQSTPVIPESPTSAVWFFTGTSTTESLKGTAEITIKCIADKSNIFVNLLDHSM